MVDSSKKISSVKRLLKDLQRQLLLMVVGICAVDVQADSTTINGITWTFFISNGQAEIGSLDERTTGVPQATTGAITIPSTLRGYPVTRIWNSAFNKCAGLTSVTIPTSVVTIDRGAFGNCSGLTSVTIPSSVKYIHNNAFFGCTSLSEVRISDLSSWCKIVFANSSANPVSYAHKLFLKGSEIKDLVIPVNVSEISDYAFYGCSGLSSVTIPESMMRIGNFAFYGCDSLSDEDGDGYFVANGWLLGCRSDAADEIDNLDSVVKIGDSALAGCRYLKRLEFSEASKLEMIGTAAFKECTELESMTLPPALRQIGEEAFMGCSYLGNVVIPGGVATVGARAFKNCTGFTAVLMEYGIESIGEECFYGDWQVSEVDIPSTVASVGLNAFGGDSSIVRIAMRGDVVKVKDVFSNCANIQEATVKVGPGPLVYDLFNKCAALENVYFQGDAPSLPTSPSMYSGTPSTLVTHVETDSTGWDGTVGSHALPQQWPVTGASRRSIVREEARKCLCKFDLNGDGLDAIDSLQQSEQKIVMPPDPTRNGYVFDGWWTKPSGGLRVTEQTIFIEGVYDRVWAHWQEGLSEDPTNVEFSFGGDAPWQNVFGLVNAEDGGHVVRTSSYWQSGKIGDGEKSELLASAFGAGKISFWWKVSCEQFRTYKLDHLSFYIDGVEQEPWINGDTEWSYLEFDVAGRTVHDFVWQYAKDDEGADGDDIGSVCAVVWTPRLETLEDYAGVTNLTLETSGDASWFGVTDVVHARMGSVRSGNVSENQISKMEATVSGEGTVGFWLKTDCERYRNFKIDHFSFCIDGVEQAWTNGIVDWHRLEFTVQGARLDHTLSWIYEKDGEGSEGEDCVWVSEVEWIPSVMGEPIPEIPIDADKDAVREALAGSFDVKLAENITDAATYNAYREWALKIGATDVKASPFAWASFATDSAALLAKMPTDDDLKVEEFKPSATAGSFDFTVSVTGVTIGDKASEDNLKKLFGLEGAESLAPAAFSTENVALEFKEPQDGKLKFTATPAVDNAKSFFMKVKVK